MQIRGQRRWALLICLSCTPAAFCGRCLAAELSDEARSADGRARALLQRAIVAFANGEPDVARAALERARAHANRRETRAAIFLELGLIAAAENQHALAKKQFVLAFSNDRRLTIDPHRYNPRVVRLFNDARAQVLGELVVVAAGTTAEVWIDGRKLGALPYRAYHQAGTHRIQLRTRHGRVLFSGETVIKPGQIRAVNVEVGVAAANRPSLAAAPQPAVARQRLWTWVVLGGALASGVAAVAVGLSARSAKGDACALLAGEELACDQRRRYLRATDAGRYRDLYERVTDRSRAANVLYGAAGVLAAAAIVAYFVEGNSNPPRSERAAGLFLAPGGVSFGGTY